MKTLELSKVKAEAMKLKKVEYRSIDRERPVPVEKPKKKKKPVEQERGHYPWYHYNRINHGGVADVE